MSDTVKTPMAVKLGAAFLSAIKTLKKTAITTHKQLTTLLRDRKKRFFVLVPVFVLLVLLLVLLSLHKASKAQAVGRDNAPATTTNAGIAQVTSITLPKQIAHIATQLQAINAQLSDTQVVTNVDAVRRSVAALSAKMATLATESQQVMHAQIQAATAPLEQQLTTIASQLKSLQRQNAENTVVSAAHLPFTVVQIDNIQQTNVVTVTYDHQTFPMTIGDRVAGWKLAAADFAKQTARFVNGKHELVKLNLSQAGDDK